MFTPAISRRGKAYFAELALARGPLDVAVTGSGEFADLFGYAWLAVLDRSEHRLRLFQARAGGQPWPLGGDPATAGWVEVPVPQLPHDVSEIRHLALAFDQSARHVVAYERAGEVWVRQWDASAGDYVMRGPWPGVDPVLVMDAEAGYYVPDSDVLLFHLSSDRKSLIMRVQRELFAAGHAIESYAEEALLDQGVSLPYQFELLGSFSSDPNGTGLVLRSDLYPVRGEDALGVAALAAPDSGVYWPVVIVRELGSDSMGSASLAAPGSGVYWPVVIIKNAADALGTALLAAPAGGEYHPIVIIRDRAESLGTAQFTPPPTGLYALVVIVVNLAEAPYQVDSVGTASIAAPAGGSYDAA